MNCEKSIQTRVSWIIWLIFLILGVTAVFISADYPPLGRYWEVRIVLLALGGFVIGFLVSKVLPGRSGEEKAKANSKWSLVFLAVLSGLWGLLIANTLGALLPAESPFLAPSWPELYMLIGALVPAIAGFWWIKSKDPFTAGLMLVMLAGTANGLVFRHVESAGDFTFFVMSLFYMSVVWKKFGRPALSNPLMWGGLLLLIVMMLSALLSPYPGNSYRYIMRLSSGWILALGIIPYKASLENKTGLWWALLSPILLIAILMVIRIIYILPIMGVTGALAQRLWIMGANPNALASAALLSLPILILMYKAINIRLVWWLVIAFVCIVMALSLSKAVWLGAVLFFCLGSVLASKNHRRNLMILSVIIVIGLLIALVFPPLRDRILGSFSFDTRGIVWSASWQSFLAHPILGVGPGNTFMNAATALRLPYEVAFPAREYLVGHSHDLWLEVLSGGGIVGLLVVLTLFFLVLRKAFRDSIWLACGVLGMLLILTFSIGLSFQSIIPLELFVLLALLSNGQIVSARWSHFAFLPLISFCALSSGAEMLKRQADFYSAYGEYERVEKRLRIAARIAPWDAGIADRQSRKYLATADYVSAEAAMDRCVALAPGRADWQARYGMILLMMEEPKEALKHLQTAVDLDDYGVIAGDIHTPLAAAQFMNGERDNALAQLKLALVRDPQLASGVFSALCASSIDPNRIEDASYQVCLCPDFAATGNVDERRRRILLYLGSQRASSSALRLVYLERKDDIKYQALVEEELSKEMVFTPVKDRLASFRVYALGLSYYAIQKAEGHCGRLISTLFGGDTMVPASLVRFISKANENSNQMAIFEAQLSLGLAAYAQKQGDMEVCNAYRTHALEVAEVAASKPWLGGKGEKPRGRFFAPETVNSDIAKAETELNAGDEKRAAGSLYRGLRLQLMTNENLDSWQSAANILSRMSDSGDMVLSRLESDFPDQAMWELLRGQIKLQQNMASEALDHFKKCLSLSQKERFITSAVIMNLFDLHETQLAVNAALRYRTDYPDDLATVVEFARRITKSGLKEQAGLWQFYIRNQFPDSALTSFSDAILKQERVLSETQIISELERARALDPTNTVILMMLSDSYQASGLDYRRGSKLDLVLRRTLAIDPGCYAAWIKLAYLEKDAKRLDSALAYARRAQQLAPEIACSTTTLADVLCSTGNMNEALALLESFNQNSPNESAILTRLVSISRELGESEKARVYFETLERIITVDIDTRKAMIDLYLAEGDVTEALKQAQKLVTDNAGDAGSWVKLGFVISMLDSMERTRDWLDHARVKYGSDPTYHLVVSLMCNSKLHSNASKRRELLKLSGSPLALSALGRLDLMDGMKESAESYLKASLALDGDELGALIGMTEILLSQDKDNEALSYAQHAVKLAPDSASVVSLLAQTQLKVGKKQDALSTIKAFCDKHPESRIAKDALAVVAWDTGDKQTAFSIYESMVREHTAGPPAYVRLAEQKLTDAKGTDAVQLMEEAVMLFPNEAWVWSTLGYVTHMTGDWSRARYALDKAVELEPTNANYRQLRRAVPAP